MFLEEEEIGWQPYKAFGFNSEELWPSTLFIVNMTIIHIITNTMTIGVVDLKTAVWVLCV